MIRYVARLNETVGYLTASVGNTAVLAYDSDAGNAARARVWRVLGDGGGDRPVPVAPAR